MVVLEAAVVEVKKVKKKKEEKNRGIKVQRRPSKKVKQNVEIRVIIEEEMRGSA